MTRTIRTALAFAAVASVVIASTALAGPPPPEGLWRSSTGNTIMMLPSSDPGFELVITTPQGRHSVYEAQWVRGFEGTQFTYRPDATTRTVTLNSHRPTAMRVNGPSGATWTLAPGRLTTTSVSGEWTSTSGNRFLIEALPDDTLVVVLIRPNGQREAFTGRWVPGLEGTQLTYGQHVATLDARTLSSMRITGSSAPSMWTRVGPAPTHAQAFGARDGRWTRPAPVAYPVRDVEVALIDRRGGAEGLACVIGPAGPTQLRVDVAGLSFACTLPSQRGAQVGWR